MSEFRKYASKSHAHTPKNVYSRKTQGENMEDVEIRVQPRLLQQQAAAAYLGMSVQTFKNTVRPHVQAKKLSHKLIIFDRYDLDRWADSLKE